ncbi:DNA helicase, partial [Tanacetum coccineum]
PSRLWRKYWKDMSYDIPKKVSERVQISDYHLNDDSLQGYTLYEIEIILSNYGKSLHTFGLPPPPQDLLAQLANRLLMEERNYNWEELAQLKNESILLLNTKQKQIYDLIINADTNNRQELIFVYGHGGTGKTFLWKTIISSLRSEGKIVLAVTSLGIASLLLPSGRTAHSRFKLPLELIEESLSLDRSLRDIVDKPSSLFGGKSVLLGGDFRKTLPVKKGASKMEVITSCISESALWPSFKVFTLKHNMRLARLDISLEERSLVNSFASWLIDVGDGKISEPAEEDPENTSWVHIPPAYCLPPDEQGLSKLIDFIYDQSTLHTPSATTLQQKVIICPKNETADIINSKVLAMVVSSGSSFVSVVPGQMTHPVASPTLDSARSYVMQGAPFTQGTISSIPIGGNISPEGFLSSILLLVDICFGGGLSLFKLSFVIIGVLGRIVFYYLLHQPLSYGWAYAFHQDRASSVRVPVANVTLFSSAQLLRENTDSVRSNQRMRPTAPSVPLKLLALAIVAACLPDLRQFDAHQQSVAGWQPKLWLMFQMLMFSWEASIYKMT